MKPRLLFSIGADGADAETIAANVMDAERLGFDYAWLSDHISDMPPAKACYDPWTSLAYLGAKTKRIMLGTSVTDVQRIHPAKMANIVATLDNLTKGRAVLGIGAGEVMNTKPYGMAWESAGARVGRLREYIKVVQSLWSSSFARPVDFHGTYYDLEDAHMTGGPYQRPRPLIYIGAYTSPLMLSLAGEIADGWLPGAYFTTKAFAEKVKVIRESAGTAGRTPGSFDLVLNIPVVFGDDRETRERVKGFLRGYLVRNRYMLKLIGADEAYDLLSKSLLYQLILPTPKYVKLLEKAEKSLPITDEHLERFLDEMVAIGSVDRCVELISGFIRAAPHTYVSAIS